MKTINILLIFSFLAFGLACQQKPEQQEETTSSIADEGRADFTKILPDFLSAAEFSAQLQSTGADFNPDILADPSRAEQYLEVKENSGDFINYGSFRIIPG
ncbi:MAG: hypothetical protein KFF73_15445 [Cyclobacteriaceae bacterium]|nr:hypothetical protein [Cyclobacteriaceae bacterium]